MYVLYARAKLEITNFFGHSLMHTPTQFEWVVPYNFFRTNFRSMEYAYISYMEYIITLLEKSIESSQGV